MHVVGRAAGVRVGERVEVSDGGSGVAVAVGLGVGVEELEEHKEEPLEAHSAEDDAAQLVEEHKLVWETHSPELPHHHWSM